MTTSKRVLLIGYGAIGRAVEQQLDTAGGYEIAIWSRTPESEGRSHCSVHSHEEARAFNPQLAVECAGQDAVRTRVPLLLADGVSVVLASVGALADSATHETLGGAWTRSRGVAIGGDRRPGLSRCCRE
jgi:aspartate dehydrogenase